MINQMVEIIGEIPLISAVELYKRQAIVPDFEGTYWMQIYPPLTFLKAAMPGVTQLCPWSIIAEVTNTQTMHGRKQQVLNALRSGQRTMRLYDLPSHRIMFTEENNTGKITVWVD